MANSAGSSSSSLPLPHLKNPIDLVDLFNSPPASAASSSSSSLGAHQQQINLSRSSYNAALTINNGQSELCFEAYVPDDRSPAPESWELAGAVDMIFDSSHSCCFTADSKYFVTSGSENSICLWNPTTRTKVANLPGHTCEVNLIISFLLNGKSMLASAAYDKTIRIWEVKDPVEPSLCVATLQSGSWVPALVFCSKQNVLISGQSASPRGGHIKFWSSCHWECLHTLSVSDSAHTLALSPDQSKLASTSFRSIQIWDIASRTEINTIQTSYEIAGRGLCFSPSHPDVLLAAGDNGTCAAWNCVTGSEIRSFSAPCDSEPTRSCPTVFSRDGKYFFTPNLYSHQLMLIDAATTTLIKTLDGPSSNYYISAACFSPNGKYIACTTANCEANFYIWEPFLPRARFILPEAAADFRLVSLSESTGLVVVRLESGNWALATAESTIEKITLLEWVLVPSSIQRPIVRFVTADGQTLMVEEKNPKAGSDDAPIFIDKNTELLAQVYSSFAKLLELKEAEKEVLRREVKIAHEEVSRMKANGGSHAKEGPMCPGCCKKPREVAIVPCGHTVCRECQPRCQVCQAVVQSTLRIFLD